MSTRVLLSIACLAALASPPFAVAQDGKTGFIHKEYDGAKYQIFVPHEHKSGEKYPVILFLHGSGETGTDGEAQVKQGIGNAIKKQEKTFPFLTILPQSHKRNWKRQLGRRQAGDRDPRSHHEGV